MNDKRYTVSQKYKISCDVLFYNGLKQQYRVPGWKKIPAANNVHKIVLETDKLLLLMFKNKEIDLRQVKCRQLHWADVLEIVERPTCYYKWESEYYYATFDWDLIKLMLFHMNVQQRHTCKVSQLKANILAYHVIPLINISNAQLICINYFSNLQKFMIG